MGYWSFTWVRGAARTVFYFVFTCSTHVLEKINTWLPVAGNQVSDFNLKLDGNPDTWHYLDIKFIKPTLPDEFYSFFLVSPPSTDTAFWNYWSARGVTASAPPGPGPLPNWQMGNVAHY
jgi:hypothetical protein